MEEAYKKVFDTIITAEYKHLKNGSVMNFISNFYTIYRKEEEYNELLSTFEYKLSLIENND
jgi:hypothetical protein